MPDPVEALILDLLRSLAGGSRPYDEVMEAWGTSCPKLPVWEEANARGFIRRIHRAGQSPHVGLSELGVLRIKGDTDPPVRRALRSRS